MCMCVCVYVCQRKNFHECETSEVWRQAFYRRLRYARFLPKLQNFEV